MSDNDFPAPTGRPCPYGPRASAVALGTDRAPLQGSAWAMLPPSQGCALGYRRLPRCGKQKCAADRSWLGYNPGVMFPLVAEIFVPIPGTGARVNLMAVILAVGVLALLVMLFVAVLAMVTGSRRRDERL
jgi:hypothetical protein